MATAITPLANITLGSTAATVTFSSISQAYKDLMLVVTPLAPTTGGGVILRFNSDSGANYHDLQIWGTGSGTGSYYNSGIDKAYIGNDATNQSVIICNIMDYSATDKWKQLFSRGNQTTGNVVLRVDSWTNTSAITSLQVLNDSQNYSAGATFALYGVSA